MEDETPREPKRAAVNPAMRNDPPRPHDAAEGREERQAEPGVHGTQGHPLNPLDAGGIAE